MAPSKKLTRADVYKQIDAFRGVSQTSANGNPSAEQWVASRRTEPFTPPRPTRRKNLKRLPGASADSSDKTQIFNRKERKD